jgi:hypothetical protein
MKPHKKIEQDNGVQKTHLHDKCNCFLEVA